MTLTYFTYIYIVKHFFRAETGTFAATKVPVASTHACVATLSVGCVAMMSMGCVATLSTAGARTMTAGVTS